MINSTSNENLPIYGRNPVIEAIKAGTSVDKLYVQNGLSDGSIKKILAMAKDARIVVVKTDKARLDKMCQGGIHQGVAAYASPFDYCDVSDILELAASKGESPFVVIADEITDPYNLGSIVRSAHQSGAHGVIIPKRNSAYITPVAIKASAGSTAFTKIAKVSNISATIDALKEKGLWVYGADAAGQNYRETDFSGGVCLVIGSEGRGMTRLVREKCDVIVSIPMKGKIDSLNASVAAGILMFEISAKRQGENQ